MSDEDILGALFGGAFFVFFLLACTVAVIMIASMWKVFVKAGKPGWAAIIPIYILLILLEIAGRPGWWFLLFLVPVLNFVMAIIVYLDLAKSFGKGAGFAVGLLLLSFVFWPILGFGDAKYLGPAAASSASPVMT